MIWVLWGPDWGLRGWTWPVDADLDQWELYSTGEIRPSPNGLFDG